MTKTIAAAVLTILAATAAVAPPPAVAQEEQRSAVTSPRSAYTFRYKDAAFQLRPLPDSKCCIEVEYEGLKGYLGVQSNGTPSVPYRFTLDPSAVTDEGVTVGSAVVGPVPVTGSITIQIIINNLHALFDRLLERHAEIEARQDFDREDAYQDLVASLRTLAEEGQAR